MSHFPAAEIAYLQSQHLARLATIGADGQPHVVPVGFHYNADADTIDIGGRGFARSKKLRDARRNPRVAVVVDDLAPGAQWTVRGVEVRGAAEVIESGGEMLRPGFDPPFVRVTPRRIISWGLETEPMRPNARSIPS
jgi:pyridoxamine 5'-phosphate oxidase family protein